MVFGERCHLRQCFFVLLCIFFSILVPLITPNSTICIASATPSEFFFTLSGRVLIRHQKDTLGNFIDIPVPGAYVSGVAGMEGVRTDDEGRYLFSGIPAETRYHLVVRFPPDISFLPEAPELEYGVLTQSKIIDFSSSVDQFQRTAILGRAALPDGTGVPGLWLRVFCNAGSWVSYYSTETFSNGWYLFPDFPLIGTPFCDITPSALPNPDFHFAREFDWFALNENIGRIRQGRRVYESMQIPLLPENATYSVASRTLQDPLQLAGPEDISVVLFNEGQFEVEVLNPRPNHFYSCQWEINGTWREAPVSDQIPFTASVFPTSYVREHGSGYHCIAYEYANSNPQVPTRVARSRTGRLNVLNGPSILGSAYYPGGLPFIDAARIVAKSGSTEIAVTRTNQEGNYTLPEIPPGTYSLSGTRRSGSTDLYKVLAMVPTGGGGFNYPSSQQAVVSLQPVQNKDFVAVTEPQFRKRVSGVARLPDGTPVSNVRVFMIVSAPPQPPVPGVILEAFTDANGMYEIDSVYEGRFTLHAAPPQGYAERDFAPPRPEDLLPAPWPTDLNGTVHIVGRDFEEMNFTIYGVVMPTPTATSTATPSLTPTPTFTATRTSTPTPTPTFTASSTSTATSTPTTAPTATNTNVPTYTPTWTASPTAIPSNTAIPTNTSTPTPTTTSTATATASPTMTATPTPSSTATVTLTPTSSPTSTSTSTPTYTPTWTASPTPTAFSPTSTPTPVHTPPNAASPTAAQTPPPPSGCKETEITVEKGELALGPKKLVSYSKKVLRRLIRVTTDPAFKGLLRGTGKQAVRKAKRWIEQAEVSLNQLPDKVLICSNQPVCTAIDNSAAIARHISAILRLRNQVTRVLNRSTRLVYPSPEEARRHTEKFGKEVRRYGKELLQVAEALPKEQYTCVTES